MKSASGDFRRSLRERSPLRVTFKRFVREGQAPLAHRFRVRGVALPQPHQRSAVSPLLSLCRQLQRPERRRQRVDVPA